MVETTDRYRVGQPNPEKVDIMSEKYGNHANTHTYAIESIHDELPKLGDLRTRTVRRRENPNYHGSSSVFDEPEDVFQVIVGTTLGDAFLVPVKRKTTEDTAFFGISHAENQKFYFDYKLKYLRHLEPLLYYRIQEKEEEQNQFICNTCMAPMFKELYDMLYRVSDYGLKRMKKGLIPEKILNRLNKFGFLQLWLDDASTIWRLSAGSVEDESFYRLLQWVRQQFGIEPNVYETMTGNQYGERFRKREIVIPAGPEREKFKKQLQEVFIAHGLPHDVKHKIGL